jgi:uncharacterized membrane protein YkgB
MIGAFVLRYSLLFFLLFFGALKWTLAEARGIEPWVSHSPLLAWTGRFGMRGSSQLIGVVELPIGTLIALRRWTPKLSAWGSIGAIGMFLVTLSFLFTTPNVGEVRAVLDEGHLFARSCALDCRRSIAGEGRHAINKL